MWRVLGLQLGIHEAILSAIESDARRNRSILSKQTIEMFRLWLDGAEGTGDEDRSWSTILEALIESGCSEVSMKVLKHFDPTATPKDIGRGEDVCVCVDMHGYLCVSVCTCVQYIHVYLCTYMCTVCTYICTYMLCTSVCICMCVLVTCVVMWMCV